MHLNSLFFEPCSNIFRFFSFSFCFNHARKTPYDQKSHLRFFDEARFYKKYYPCQIVPYAIKALHYFGRKIKQCFYIQFISFSSTIKEKYVSYFIFNQNIHIKVLLENKIPTFFQMVKVNAFIPRKLKKRKLRDLIRQ